MEGLKLGDAIMWEDDVYWFAVARDDETSSLVVIEIDCRDGLVRTSSAPDGMHLNRAVATRLL